MAAQPTGFRRKHRTFSWHGEQLAQATGLNLTDVRIYFTDGRRASFLVERRLCKQLGWSLADSERHPYDIVDNGAPNGKWEVRCVTANGVNLAPSRDQGSGRKFSDLSLQQKLNLLRGYILADITVFPAVNYYFFVQATVKTWVQNGKLNANGSIPYARFINELSLDATDPIEIIK